MFHRRPFVVEQRTTGAGRWQQRYIALLLAVDVLVVLAAVIAGLCFPLDGRTRPSHLSWLEAAALAAGWVVLLSIGGAHSRRRVGSSGEGCRAIFEASVRMMALVGFVLYLSESAVSRGFFLVTLPCGTIALLVGRAAGHAILNRLRRADRCLYRVLAVGRADDVTHLVRQLARQPGSGLRVVGACVPHNGELDDVPVVGQPSRAAQLAIEHGADAVAVTEHGVLGPEGVRRLAWELEGSDVALLVAPALVDVAGPRILVKPVGGVPLLCVEEPRFSGLSRVAKSMVDRAIAGFALLLLAPVMLVIAAAIKFDSRGPVFFRQTRSGLGGRHFRMVKFRSMVVQAEELLIDLTDKNETGGLLFKMRLDPRVTRVGRFLRRTSLDELPQLWNVLVGHMSLVGPRPPLPSEVAKYGSDVRRRLLVKPGLTGLWQVSGRSDLSWEEAVRLDLYYVENWSLVLDAVILARTVGAVIKARGAY